MTLSHDQQMMVFAIKCNIDDGRADIAGELARDLAHQLHTPHFIGGSGTYGCLYDGCGVYRTLQDAVDGLAETFSLGRTRKAKLARYRHLDLNPGTDGADYCDIQVCNCSKPWIHDEMMTESDWSK